MNRKITIAMAATLAAASITIAAGCGGDSAQVPTADDLKGTWTQKAAGFEQGKAVTWNTQTIVIDTVDGQGFAGFKEYMPRAAAPRGRPSTASSHPTATSSSPMRTGSSRAPTPTA